MEDIEDLLAFIAVRNQEDAARVAHGDKWEAMLEIELQAEADLEAKADGAP